MSIYLRNLPSGTRYWEVKTFLKNDCGISSFIVDSLEPDKAGRIGTMKVTVNLSDAEDLNKLTRQSSFKGQYLIVEEHQNLNQASNNFPSFNNPRTNYRNSANPNFDNSNFDEFNYNQGINNRNQDNIMTGYNKPSLGDRRNQDSYNEDAGGFNPTGYGYGRDCNMDNIQHDNRQDVMNRPSPIKPILVNRSLNRTGYNQDSGSLNNAGYSYDRDQNTGYENEEIMPTPKPLFSSFMTTNQTQPPSYGQFQRNQPERQTNLPSLFDGPRLNIAPRSGNSRSDRTYHDQTEPSRDRNVPQFSQNEGYRSSDPIVGHGQFSEPLKNIPQKEYYDQPIKSLMQNTFQSPQQYNTTGFSQPRRGVSEEYMKNRSNDQISVTPLQPLLYGKQDSLRSKLSDNSPQRSTRWVSGSEVFERALERYDSKEMYHDNHTQIKHGNQDTYSTQGKRSTPPILRHDYTGQNDQPNRSFEKRPFYEINEYTENRRTSGSMGNKGSRSSRSLDRNRGRNERNQTRSTEGAFTNNKRKFANQSFSDGPPSKKSAPTAKPFTGKSERFTRPNVQRQPPYKSAGINKASPLLKSTNIGKLERFARPNVEIQPPKKSTGNNKILPLLKSTYIGKPEIFARPNVKRQHPYQSAVSNKDSPSVKPTYIGEPVRFGRTNVDLPCKSTGTGDTTFVKPTNIKSQAPKQLVVNKTSDIRIMEDISKTKLNNPQVVELLEKSNQGLLSAPSYIDFGRDKGVRVNMANVIAKDILKELGFNVQNKINEPKIKKLVQVILVRFKKLFGNTLQFKGKAVLEGYKKAYAGEDIAAFMNMAFNAKPDELIDIVGTSDKNNDKTKSTEDKWFDLSTAVRREALHQEIEELTDLFRQELMDPEGAPDEVMQNDMIFNITVDAFSQVMKHQLEHRLQRQIHNSYLQIYVYSGKLPDKADAMKALSQHGVIHLLKSERDKMFIAQVDTLENYDKLFEMETITIGNKKLKIDPMYFRAPKKIGNVRSGPREQSLSEINYQCNSEITETGSAKVPEVSKQKEVTNDKVNVTTVPKDTNERDLINEKVNLTTLPEESKKEEVTYKKVNLDDSDIQVKDKTLVCIDLTDDLLVESDDFVIDSLGSAIQISDDVMQQEFVSTDDKNDKTATESTDQTEKSEIEENVKECATHSHDETPQNLPANGAKKYASLQEKRKAKIQRRAERKRFHELVAQNQEAKEQKNKEDEVGVSSEPKVPAQDSQAVDQTKASVVNLDEIMDEKTPAQDSQAVDQTKENVVNLDEIMEEKVQAEKSQAMGEVKACENVDEFHNDNVELICFSDDELEDY